MVTFLVVAFVAYQVVVGGAIVASRTIRDVVKATTRAIQKKYNEIQFDVFQNDFLERFGLKIPINALITIFNRARKKKIFKSV